MDTPTTASAGRRLAPEELITRCDLQGLAVALDGDAPSSLVGQRRALDAAELALAMPHEGYHLFISGPPGSGKRTLAQQAIATRVRSAGVRRSDWVYVHNFAQAHRPVALQLPAGRGAQLRRDMRALVDELRSMIPAMFESDEYVGQVERIVAEYKERAEQALEGIAQEAQRRGFAMIRTPVGFTFAPAKDGEVLAPEAFEALSPEQRDTLQRSLQEIQEQLVKVLRTSMRAHKEQVDRVRAATRAMTSMVVEHALDDLLHRYADLPAVHRHLQAVRDDVVEHADDFRPKPPEAEPSDELARYEINLLVDASEAGDGAAIEADLPTYANLLGRVDYLPRFGTLVTDFRLIKPGLLHRANGGHLLIDALKLLTQPFAWDALKRALKRQEIRIESLGDLMGLVSTVHLEPDPIPLQVKVVLMGERHLWSLLQALDPEFGRLFRIQADLADELPRQASTQVELARALAGRLRAAGLLAPSPAALATLVEHGARVAGDAQRIDANVQRLLDVAFEAEHVARAGGATSIEASHVRQAVAARRHRAALAHERMQQAMLRDIMLIDTAGSRVGQVNGLSVFAIGDEWFGAPMRITATSRLGEGHVVDVQRESQMSGPVHAKGVLILSSFIATRYSRLHSLAVHASLVFEQTYGMVEGDSASLGELVALLSSIGDTPVVQSLAVTGSVNQFGQVQAIGGVNEKIEGFFELCRARGLAGQGVVVPQANVAHLMLADAVIEAVREGRFVLHAVTHVDEALQIMTGLPAGDPARPADDTVNGRVLRRLSEFSARRQLAERPRRDPSGAARPRGEHERRR